MHTSIPDAIVSLRSRHKIVCPPCITFAEYAFAGGLVSCAPPASPMRIGRQAITLDESLRVKNLLIYRVVQTTKFDFVVNMKTAKALGLTAPFGLLNAADEAIE